MDQKYRVRSPNEKIYGAFTVLLYRRGGTAGIKHQSAGFMFTNHFVERYIQQKTSSEEDYVVNIAEGLMIEFARYAGSTNPGSQHNSKNKNWREWGRFAYATKNLLILGGGPEAR